MWSWQDDPVGALLTTPSPPVCSPAPASPRPRTSEPDGPCVRVPVGDAVGAARGAQEVEEDPDHGQQQLL